MRWGRYVPVRERRRRAERETARMRKAGHRVEPVEIEGRDITTTFWGRAWCDNLESYSDFESRLPRGRTYVRNGSVIHLGIAPGRVRSLVYGSELYEVEIGITRLPRPRWTALQERCAGRIGSLVELLGGSISGAVMEVVTAPGEGLFPSPTEITLDCTCPDWAFMCKHVAAALYGVGARLDHAPELLFTLRGVDPADMVQAAAPPPSDARPARPRSGKLLAAGDVSSVFGVDIDMGEAPVPVPAAEKPARKKAAKKTTSRKPAAKKKPSRKPAAKKKKAAKKKTSRKPAAKKKPANEKTSRKAPRRRR